MMLRKIKGIALIFFVIVIVCAYIGCKPVIDTSAGGAGGSGGNDGDGSSSGGKPPTVQTPDETKTYKSCVTFLDVGNGECIFIEFPDGKTVMVDCGRDNESDRQKILDYVKNEWANKIDYFIYTHPDIEHTANAEYIINNFIVGKIFLPKIKYPNTLLFPEFVKFKELAEQKEISIDYSDMYKCILGDGYALMFLTPQPFNGSYTRFNGNPMPTGEEVDNLSPIIYLEIYGIRFMLTGDARKLEEQTLLELYTTGIYESFYKEKGVNINIDNIDYLKVAGGGFNEGSSQEFLNRVCPKTAVFMVSGNNYSGNPQTTVLKRLQNANENYRILRTDVDGTFRVFINPDNDILEKKGN